MTTRIQMGCGCGFTTRSLVEAEDHANAKGHKLDVHGMVEPANPVKASQVRALQRSIRSQVPENGT
jgi:hypothetical protein